MLLRIEKGFRTWSATLESNKALQEEDHSIKEFTLSTLIAFNNFLLMYCGVIDGGPLEASLCLRVTFFKKLKKNGGIGQLITRFSKNIRHACKVNNNNNYNK